MLLVIASSRIALCWCKVTRVGQAEPFLQAQIKLHPNFEHDIDIWLGNCRVSLQGSSSRRCVCYDIFATGLTTEDLSSIEVM
jgi:hypothetical protein